MAEDKQNLLHQMREIVHARQKIDSNHPHSIGISFLSQQNFNAAVEKFREAIALNPQFSFSFHYLGSALFETENLAEAEKYFLQATELNPHYAATYLYLGKIEADKENWREAEKYYRQSLDLRPDLSEAMVRLATVLLEIAPSGNDEIIELLRKVRQTDYANEWILAQLISLHPIEAVFYLELADEFFNHGQTHKALYLYRLTIFADDKLPLAKLKLANILFGMGKSEEAKEYLHSARNLSNQTIETLRLMGDLFFRLEYFSEAITAYRQALKFNPVDAEIYKKIGDSLARQNQFAKAKIEYQKAIKFGYNY